LSRAIFITGAGSGLGAALTLECAKRGWRVGLCGRNLDSLTAVKKEIAAAGGGLCEIFAMDVTNADGIEAAIDSFKPDSLVCCAAILDFAFLDDLTPNRFAATMAVNVQGTFNACRAAMLGWKRTNVIGDIVTVSSLGGIRGQQRFTGFSAYAASKHAVVGLTEALAIEGQPNNIRVNAIAPGAFNTKMSRSLGLTAKTSAAEILPTIIYLLDRGQSGPVTGTTIEIPCNDY
jgi:NAD(P)-dependent dehydrogenase (short-subunit alcohol dehydrogenase family)